MTDTSLDGIQGYGYRDAQLNPSHSILLPAQDKMLAKHVPGNQSIFDLGCGNGSVASHLKKKGHDPMGVDASEEGIAFAKSSYPNLRLEQASVYDDLRE